MAIKIRRIPLKEALDFLQFPDGTLAEYLRPRPDILEHTDIFCENCRSKDQKYRDFSLFQEVTSNDSDVVYVYPIYLELYEYSRMDALSVMCYFSMKYFPNKVVFQWNHDVDFAKRFPTVSDLKNAYIINFNTSKPTTNDIVVPFWVINTDPVEEPKRYTAGFVGSPNTNLRAQLIRNMTNPTFIYKNGLPQNEYLKLLSSCRFSLCPRGQGLGSYRFFECFHLNTIPVLIADDLALPFINEIDYSDISVRIPEADVESVHMLEGILGYIDEQKILNNIKLIKHKFSLLGVQQEVHRRLM